MTDLCVIYDLDGTLVDSEGLNYQAFLDLLPELDDTAEALLNRYRGKKMTLIFADLEHRLGRKLPEDFEDRYRNHVAELFESGLKPMPGVHEMLTATAYPRCIASSGPRAKISQALEVCGLAPFFGGHIFSSYEVGSWKPDPGLFLHAAQAMGFSPERCVVVEDSPAGVKAAAAAGMKVLLYAPEANGSAAPGVAAFRDMSELPRLLKQCAADQP